MRCCVVPSQDKVLLTDNVARPVGSPCGQFMLGVDTGAGRARPLLGRVGSPGPAFPGRSWGEGGKVGAALRGEGTCVDRRPRTGSATWPSVSAGLGVPFGRGLSPSPSPSFPEAGERRAGGPAGLAARAQVRVPQHGLTCMLASRRGGGRGRRDPSAAGAAGPAPPDFRVGLASRLRPLLPPPPPAPPPPAPPVPPRQSGRSQQPGHPPRPASPSARATDTSLGTPPPT